MVLCSKAYIGGYKEEWLVGIIPISLGMIQKLWGYPDVCEHFDVYSKKKFWYLVYLKLLFISIG